jgi:alpha-1,6-mannosyltransferase
MTRIAHIANMYGPKSGGLKTTMLELSREYESRGNAVLLVTPGRKDSIETKGRITYVTVSAPKIPFSGGYRIILRTRHVIRRVEDFRPDIIEISDRTTLLRVARWAKRQRIPTTFFAHERVDGVVENFAKYLPYKGRLVDKWNLVTQNSVGRIVATTNFAAQEFCQLGLQIGSTPKSKLVSVPLGVDLDRFTPVVRSEITIQENSPYIFACTRLSKEKDPIFLLEIAEELKNRGLDIPLVIAGSGPLQKKMQHVIEKKNLNVQLLGFISDKNELSDLMGKASVFLAVGPIETFGLAALETLATGTPVICRREAAISEIISWDSGRALTRSHIAWADAIDEFMNLNRMSTQSSARARAEKFTWEKTADQLLSMYRWDNAS